MHLCCKIYDARAPPPARIINSERPPSLPISRGHLSAFKEPGWGRGGGGVLGWGEGGEEGRWGRGGEGGGGGEGGSGNRAEISGNKAEIRRK